jgi:hypothetical protein
MKRASSCSIQDDEYQPHVSDFARAASDELVSGNKRHTLGTYVPPREQCFPHLSCIFLIYPVHPADKFGEKLEMLCIALKQQ